MTDRCDTGLHLGIDAGCTKSAPYHRKIRDSRTSLDSRSRVPPPSRRKSTIASSSRLSRPSPTRGPAGRVGHDTDPQVSTAWTRGSLNRRIFPCSMSSSDSASPAILARGRSKTSRARTSESSCSSRACSAASSTSALYRLIQNARDSSWLNESGSARRRESRYATSSGRSLLAPESPDSATAPRIGARGS